jgi:holo-[acyl-carrier protein] synthase
MIVGFGSDLVDIRRIEQALARFGRKFERRVFTDAERAKADSRSGERHNSKAATLAKRFAAKEAFSKAVGTGFTHGVYMRDIEVANLPGGKPTLNLREGALKAANRLIPEGKRLSVHVTLSDEYPQALAVVVLEAL